MTARRSERPLEIICAHHRPFPHSDAPHIVNVHAGKASATSPLPFPGDDTGDTISSLNPGFAELTALYWYWRNRPLAEHVGLCHYRRYFDLRRPRLAFRRDSWRLRRPDVTALPSDHFAESRVDSAQSVQRIIRRLRGHDVLLAQPMTFPMSLSDQYVRSHGASGWQTLMSVLDERGAGRGERAEEFFDSRTTLHAWNMFVFRRPAFEAYLEWLFPILFAFHSRLPYPRDDYQRRAPGFAAERLLNFYVHQERLEVATVPVVYFEG